MKEPNYVYRCTITRVVDGDTVDAKIDLGFNMEFSARIRMMGIDTPESRTRNRREKRLGLASKARLKELIREAPLLPGKRGKKAVFLQTTKDGRGKFGRILGTLWIGDQNVNDMLVREDHARPYYGGSKGELGPWTRRIHADGTPIPEKTKTSAPDVWLRWTSRGYVVIADTNDGGHDV